MSTDIEFLDLQIKLHQATPEQQRSLLRWLVSRVVAEQGSGGPQEIEGDGGDPLGVFIPNAFYRNQPPALTDKEYAELLDRVRNTTPDQLITHEELIRQLGLEDVPLPSKR